MDFKILSNEQEYEIALQQLGEIFDAPTGTPESDEANILSLLIDDYEKKHYPIEPPDPIEAIIIRMEEMNLKQRDLVGIFGGKNRVSEVLNRKRKLTVEMIRKLNSQLHLSPEILIREYELSD
ncbi:MAG: transcriptional regulator [Bacteroidota bacterium]